MNVVTKTFAGLILLVHLCSCQDTYTICDQNIEVFERCGFYHITAGVEQPATPPLLTVQLLGSPSPFYTNSGVTKFNIPLNPILDSAKYQLFVYPNSYPDTLTLVYTSQPFTVNPDCGSIYIHNLTRLSLTKHHLDSAIIVNNMINTTSGENIKIYL